MSVKWNKVLGDHVFVKSFILFSRKRDWTTSCKGDCILPSPILITLEKSPILITAHWASFRNQSKIKYSLFRKIQSTPEINIIQHSNLFSKISVINGRGFKMKHTMNQQQSLCNWRWASSGLIVWTLFCMLSKQPPSIILASCYQVVGWGVESKEKVKVRVSDSRHAWPPTYF